MALSRVRSSGSARVMVGDSAEDRDSGRAMAVLAGPSPQPLKALQVGCGHWDCASARGQVCHSHGDIVGPACQSCPATLLLAPCPCVPTATS